jgi:hypothetical protein
MTSSRCLFIPPPLPGLRNETSFNRGVSIPSLRACGINPKVCTRGPRTRRATASRRRVQRPVLAVQRSRERPLLRRAKGCNGGRTRPLNGKRCISSDIVCQVQSRSGQAICRRSRRPERRRGGLICCTSLDPRMRTGFAPAPGYPLGSHSCKRADRGKSAGLGRCVGRVLSGKSRASPRFAKWSRD